MSSQPLKHDNLKYGGVLLVVPAYNEADSIGHLVDRLHSFVPGADILVVNDGSQDGTAEVLRKKDLFVVTHPFNMGIGVTFQTGCKFAVLRGYEYIVRMDGDGQHDVRFVAKLLEPVFKNKLDITVGSRFLGDSSIKSTFFRLVGIRIIAFFIAAITGKRVTDPTSGFCAMNRKAFAYFADYCVDVILNLKYCSITVFFVSVRFLSASLSAREGFLR